MNKDIHILKEIINSNANDFQKAIKSLDIEDITIRVLVLDYLTSEFAKTVIHNSLSKQNINIHQNILKRAETKSDEELKKLLSEIIPANQKHDETQLGIDLIIKEGRIK